MPVGARDAASRLARLLPVVDIGCPHGIVHTGKHRHTGIVGRHAREGERYVAVYATHDIVEVDGCIESHEYSLQGAVGLKEGQEILAIDIGKECKELALRHAILEIAIDRPQAAMRLMQFTVDRLLEREVLTVNTHYAILDIHSCGYRHLRSVGSLWGTQHKRSSQLLGQGLHLCHKRHTAADAVKS